MLKKSATTQNVCTWLRERRCCCCYSRELNEKNVARLNEVYSTYSSCNRALYLHAYEHVCTLVVHIDAFSLEHCIGHTPAKQNGGIMCKMNDILPLIQLSKCSLAFLQYAVPYFVININHIKSSPIYTVCKAFLLWPFERYHSFLFILVEKYLPAFARYMVGYGQNKSIVICTFCESYMKLFVW